MGQQPVIALQIQHFHLSITIYLKIIGNFQSQTISIFLPKNTSMKKNPKKQTNKKQKKGADFDLTTDTLVEKY